MAKKFQDLTVDYKSLMRMNVNERFLMAQSNQGSSLLASALTPRQLASLFPRYYQEKLPDIGGFRAALTPQGRGLVEKSETLRSGSGNRTAASTKSSDRYSPSWMKKVKEATGGVDISDPGAKARLSGEKKKVLDLLKQGQIDADDPSVSFLKDISTSDLQKMGLVTSKEKDKTYFKAAEITDDEAKAEIAKTSSGEGKTIAKVITAKEGRSIVVEMDDGSVKRMTGDRNWRNNNPGNLEASPWTKKQPGYLGTDGRFAIFSTSEQGRKAKNNLLFNTYKDKTIGSAIEKFAPSFENDTAAYIARVSKQIGVKPGTKLQDLTPEQKMVMLDAMKSVEGGKTGQIEILKKGLKIQGTPTDQQITEAKVQIQAQREQAGADIFAAKEKLPPNVNPKFTVEYEKMSPGQKQETLKAIDKTGVDKFNEIYQKNPEQTVQAVATGTSPGSIRTTDYHQTTRDGYIQEKGFNTRSGNGQECVTLSKAFNKEAGAASTWKKRVYVDNSKIQPGVMVATTAYNDGSGGKRGQNYHTGIAVTAPDKDGNFKVLDQFKGGPAKIRTMNVNRGYKGAEIGVLKGAENPNISALQAARAIAEREGDKQTVAQMDQSITNYQTQIANNAAGKNDFAQGSANEAKTVTGVDIVKDPEAQVRGEPTVKGAETKGSDIVRPSTPGTPGATDPNAKTDQTLVAETKVPDIIPNKIAVNADGGIEKLSTNKITAYPISDLKGDNSVVVDKNEKPLFTMNTNRETATYDPKTKDVTIDPVTTVSNKKYEESVSSKKGSAIPVLADGGKIDLKESAPVTPTQNEAPVNQSNMAQGTSYNDNSVQISMSASPLTNRCPSFDRAMSASEFKKSGNHFDNGTANLR